MNLTISIDDDLLRRARELAADRGTSIQALLRAHLEALVNSDAVADELLALMDATGGRSGGRPFRREDPYEDRPGPPFAIE